MEERVNGRMSEGLKQGLQSMFEKIDNLIQEKVQLIIKDEIEERMKTFFSQQKDIKQQNHHRSDTSMNSLKSFNLFMPQIGAKHSRQYCRSPLDNTFAKLSTMSTINESKLDLKFSGSQTTTAHPPSLKNLIDKPKHPNNAQLTLKETSIPK